MKVIIPSCQKMSDLWKPCITLLRKFWRDCPWEVHLLTDGDVKRGDYSFDVIHSIQRDLGWCVNLRNYLVTLPDTHVFVLLEDMLTCGLVDNDFVTAVGTFLEEDPAGCFRFYPAPATPTPNEQHWGIIPNNTPYRICTAPAIWRKNYLLRLLAYHTIWEFELLGTPASDRMPEVVYSVAEKFYPFPVIYSAVTQGLWEPAALNFLAMQRIAVKSFRGIRQPAKTPPPTRA